MLLSSSANGTSGHDPVRVTLEVDLISLLLEKGLMPMLTTLPTLYSLQKLKYYHIVQYSIHKGTLHNNAGSLNGLY